MAKHMLQSAGKLLCKATKAGAGLGAVVIASTLCTHAAIAADKPTVAYIAPAIDYPYWQWVAYGVKQRAAELGMNYVELSSDNSPAKQMDNIHTALTRGATAIVMGPVSSSSTPPVLRLLKSKSIPVAFTGIGPQTGETDYTSAVTANNYDTGKLEASYVCKLAKDRGGNKVAMLSLPQDRENAQKYLKGANEAFKKDGCDLVQILEAHDLSVNEAVTEANDILTAHPDVKAIYAMFDNAGIGAAKALQTRGLVGKVGVVAADGSPSTIKLVRDGVIQGVFVQGAMGQGIDATTQVFNALNHKPTTQVLSFTEVLVTGDTVDRPDVQAAVKRVYPPSVGKY